MQQNAVRLLCWNILIKIQTSIQSQLEKTHAASVLLLHLSGTIYRDTSKTTTLVVSNSFEIWRHFCLHRPIRQRCLWEHLFKRCFINGLTYLLTYLPSWSLTNSCTLNRLSYSHICAEKGQTPTNQPTNQPTCTQKKPIIYLPFFSFINSISDCLSASWEVNNHGQKDND